MIPVVVTPTQAPPSPQAEELAELLALSIQEFQQRRPETSAHDVRVALRLTAQRAVPSGNQAMLVGIALLLAGLLAGAVVFLMLQSGKPQDLAMPIAASLGILGAIVGILAVARRRG